MDTILYTYRGSTFRLIELYAGMRHQIVELCKAADVVWIPRNYGNATIDWNVKLAQGEYPDACRIFENVRMLYIPSWVSQFHADNRMFPNLERLEVSESNKSISSIDTMLLINGELKYVFSAGMKQKCVVPKGIRRIGTKAFAGTTCNDIVFENPQIKYRIESFVGSVWFEGDIENHPFCMIGDLLFRCRMNQHTCTLPDNVRDFDDYAFKDCSELEHIISPIEIPMSCDHYCGIHKLFDIIKKYTITQLKTRLNLNDLRRMNVLEWFEIQEDLYGQYCTIDGVLFSKDKTKLVYYPKGRKDVFYRIPDGTEAIGDNAFRYNLYLEEIVMPDSVHHLGMAAFFRCFHLKKIRFSDNLRIIPGTSTIQHGVFEDCTVLSEIRLPAHLESIGCRAFYNTRLQEINIDGGVKYIGAYAFAKPVIVRSKCNGMELAVPGPNKVQLPPTIKVIECGAIGWSKEVLAWEGTAFGLIEAIEGITPETGYPVWERAIIRMIKHDDSKLHAVDIPLPLQIQEGEPACIDLAWNGHVFDRDMYYDAFHLIHNLPTSHVLSNNHTMENAPHHDAQEIIACDEGIQIDGQTLVRCGLNVKILNLPDEVRQIDPNVLIIPNIQVEELISAVPIYLSHSQHTIRKYTIKRVNDRMDIDLLRKYRALESLNIQESGETDYCTVDGILFSKDKKTLIYYPQGRSEPIYEIPEGTETIAPKAFMSNCFIETVIMPDSVITLGMSAFYGCEKLIHIQFSDRLEMIPGVTYFNSKGVFEGCKNLYALAWPKNLKIIGSYAFFNSGIRKIEVPEGVEYIGDYAFASYSPNQKYCFCEKKPLVESCTLPSSLIHIGEGAISGAKRVQAFEGRTTGLLRSIEACAPTREHESISPTVYTNNIIWGECVIDLIQSKDKTEIIDIPGSLNEKYRCYLDFALNQPNFDYEAYDCCFAGIAENQEKKQFAFRQYSRIGNRTLSTKYLKSVAMDIAKELIAELREDELVTLIKFRILSKANIKQLLSLASDTNMTSACGYMMACLSDDRPKRGSLSL